MSYQKIVKQPETATLYGGDQIVVNTTGCGHIRIEIQPDIGDLAGDWVAAFMDKKRARKLARALLKAAAKV